MASLVMVGGGVVGLGAAMMLAKDGHDVLVLERDGQAPPPDLEEAWDGWERRGVTQFRLAHMFLARYRQIVEAELPEVASALEAGGALRQNPVKEAPDMFSGGERDGDGRFGVLTGRRVMVERVVASQAEVAAGVAVRRGTAVVGLLTGEQTPSGIPHVVGVRTGTGEEIFGDLVIDVSGRRSALPAWLRDIGAAPPGEEIDDSGFVYYGRHYRSSDGSVPVSLGGALQEYGSISSLTLPADNGVWSTALVARSDDRQLRGLKEVSRWEHVFRSLPTVAHWLDGEPIEDHIVVMAKLEDRIRDLCPQGGPVATGIVNLADSWACTNPSLGRGASLGMMHSQVLRDCIRDTGLTRPAEFAETFAAATARTVEPWYRSTVSFDRNRLDEMGAVAEDRPFEASAEFEIAKAMQAAMLKDPDCFRAFLDVVMVLAPPEEVIGRPGLFEKIMELGGGWRDDEVLGPNREQLVAMASG